MSTYAGTLFVAVALIFLAGCSTTPKTGSGGASPDNWSAKTVENKLFAHANPPPPGSLSPGSHTHPPAARANVVLATPLRTWTSLNRWAYEQKIEAPRRISISPVTSYAVATTNGVLVLTIGTRDATWRGTTFHLGFAPEFIDSQIFVHGLDLEKNIAPLLRGTSSFFNLKGVIVIDPGHGGINAGTLSVLDNRPEKEFTLDWARRLQRLLEAEGWHVFLTRTNDYDEALSNRVSFAESHHADLFISLHFNSSAPDKRQIGLETYCLTPTGTPSTLTRGYPDVLTDHFPNNDYDVRNLQLAMRVHKAVLRASEEEDRGVRRARFLGVLRGQKRPAILIEGGYLSNPHEAEKIENPDFRQALAEGVANALK